MALIKPGRLDRRVTIQRRGASVHDGYSNKPGAWADVATRWTSIKPARGGEPVEAEGLSGLAVMSFWMRWDSVTSAITERDALVHDGARFEIVAPPMEVGRREGVEIFARRSEVVEASEPAA